MILSPSFTQGNRFYLFRRTGIEVQIDLIDGIFYPDRKLHHHEKAFLKRFFNTYTYHKDVDKKIRYRVEIYQSKMNKK